MKLKTLRPVAAAMIVASLGPVAIADTLEQHPAVQVAQTWSSRGIDPNTFIVGHPAGNLITTDAVSSESQSIASYLVGAQVGAQAQAAALLSHPAVSNASTKNDRVPSTVRVSASTDAQASAAALLSSSRTRADSWHAREMIGEARL